MSKAVRFDERLLTDVWTARQWYENQQQGLGERFVASFHTAIEFIRRHPLGCPLFKPFAARGVRHSLLPDFPYAIYFRVNLSEVFVFLVFHGARDPRQLRRAIAQRTL